MKKLKLIPIVIFFAVSLFVKTSAATLSFNYSGFQQSIDTSAQGSGSFSFADGLTQVGVQTLASFNFTDVVDNPSIGQTTYVFTLADLNSFTLLLTGPTPFLELATKSILGTGACSTCSASFFVGESTGGPIGTTSPDILGLVTFTPEPASLALFGLAALTAGVVARKRTL